ncbi:sel1 repeat family protein [Aggregatibacter actinomycetemcomitans]|nr:sel1 repeat family protein [Aggregatibacter actinomycetemcomitans]
MQKYLLIIGVILIAISLFLGYFKKDAENIHIENGTKKLIVESKTYTQDSNGNMHLISHWTESKFQELKKLAESGNSKAQGTLGYMYLKGEFVHVDHSKAEYWLKKSADSGELAQRSESQFNLGFLYEEKGDLEKAIKWYLLAAENNFINAQINLGILYEEKGLISEAKKWYKRASELNDGDAKYYLALLLYEETPNNIEETLSLLKSSLNTASNKAKVEYSLSWLYLNDKSVKNIDLGLQHLESSANHGEVESEFLLGEIYEKGELLPKDLSKSQYWYKKAAGQGMEEAIEKVKKL